METSGKTTQAADERNSTLSKTRAPVCGHLCGKVVHSESHLQLPRYPHVIHNRERRKLFPKLKNRAWRAAGVPNRCY